MELNPLAQSDGIHQSVLTDGVALGQDRLHFIILIEREQRLVDVHANATHDVGIDAMRVHGRRIGRNGNVQLGFIASALAGIRRVLGILVPSVIAVLGCAASGEKHRHAQRQSGKTGAGKMSHIVILSVIY